MMSSTNLKLSNFKNNLTDNMFDRIETLERTLLLGRYKQMSYLDNQTAALWQGFMPLKKKFQI